MNLWIAPASSAWPLAGMAFMLLCVGAWVAQDAAKRVLASTALVAFIWRVVFAVALGSSFWASHVVMVAGMGLGFPVGYRIAGILGAWLLAMVSTGFATFALRSGRVTFLRLCVAVLPLVAGVVLTSWVAVLSMGLQPGVIWRGVYVALGAIVVMVGMGVCVIGVCVNHHRSYRLWWLKTAVAGAFGLTVVLSQQFIIFAFNWGGQKSSLFHNQLGGSTLTALASGGTLVLLVVIWLGLLIESHLRDSMSRVNGEIERNANTDLLTGLPNRLSFEASLAKAARKADESKTRLALMVIDLDGFKPINEVFGHNGGDRVLREMASRLRSLVGPNDRLARLGSDEFLLLLTENPTEAEAAACAQQVLSRLSAPCKLDRRDACVTSSIGVAMYPSHGAVSALITHADVAMRSSKTAGGAAFSFFEQQMMNAAREQVELLQDLRFALANKQFELLYQLKIHAPSGEITGAEALLRWRHPKRGVISPLVFIPMAERFGLINAIGGWVIEEACRQIRSWHLEGLRMRLAVNLSVHQLRQPDLPDRIAETLRRHKIKPDLLTCEITETVAMDDAKTTMVLIEKLAAVGVHISIDDFGTGYSSLSYLRKLPAGELKIDRSFVLDLETSSDARALVDAVIKLAQALSLRVVAEGVETEEQHQILRALGCDILQGFLFAKPMTAQALSMWAMKDEGPRNIDFRRSLFDPSAPELG